MLSYEIVSSEVDDGICALMLAPCGADTFMEKMAATPKMQERAALIARTMRRVSENGVDWAFESKTFKSLEPELSLCELRVKGKIIRVMTYIHDNQVPIYLFDFDGHQGKRSNIPANIKRKGKELAKIARECMAKETMK